MNYIVRALRKECIKLKQKERSGKRGSWGFIIEEKGGTNL